MRFHAANLNLNPVLPLRLLRVVGQTFGDNSKEASKGSHRKVGKILEGPIDIRVCEEDTAGKT